MATRGWRRVLERGLDAGVVLAGLAALVASVVAVSSYVHRRKQTAPGASVTKVADWRTYSTHGHRVGSDEASVLIVVFGDYQCPFCAKADSVLSAVRAEYPRQVAIVYRHFPLTAVHPFAWRAALAAECAAADGHFTEFHHVLYANQRDIGVRSWRWYGEQAGLAKPRDLKRCVDDERYRSAVSLDRDDGIRLGIQGTPAILVEDELLTAAPSRAELEGIVNRELKRTRH